MCIACRDGQQTDVRYVDVKKRVNTIRIPPLERFFSMQWIELHQDKEIRMDGKRVKDSIFITSLVTLPQDANAVGNVHGGVIMKHIDSVRPEMRYFPQGQGR